MRKLVDTAAMRRRLHRGHFAFMRALVQGLDPRTSWDLYLAADREASDLRLIRNTIAWLRNEFAAAAHRYDRHGTARLVLIDTSVVTAPEGEQPSLEDFAWQRGLQDFTEAEQLAAYAEAFGAADRRVKRRQSLIDRQLAAIAWLEDLIAQDPQPDDHVDAWFDPRIARRLREAGLSTLQTLADRINAIGQNWHACARGIGTLKAARIVDWLRAHPTCLRHPIGEHALQPRRTLSAARLAAVVTPAAALVPLEKFVTPAELNGSDGRFRAPPDRCLLAASNDYEAVLAWLDSKAEGEGGPLSATQRSYRKEAERLLLWSILVRRTPLSSLTSDDALAFRSFLRAPPAHWCGPRYRQRWSPLWRPLEGPLNVAALDHALRVLRAFYAFLMQKHYVVSNPFAVSAVHHATDPHSSRDLDAQQ